MDLPKERRTAPCVKLGKQARFLYYQDLESDGHVQNISETGAVILSDAPVKIGDIVILYPNGMGRIPSEVVRLFDGGFALSFILTIYQRGSMNQRIAMAQQALALFPPLRQSFRHPHKTQHEDMRQA